VNSPAPKPSHMAIDERWLLDWVGFGMLEIAAYLSKHAAFAEYCKKRDESGRRADRR
jgi:hypothetical protein